eukprot:11733974-Heterocapsa_arctica.AAC.1
MGALCSTDEVPLRGIFIGGMRILWLGPMRHSRTRLSSIAAVTVTSAAITELSPRYFPPVTRVPYPLGHVK